MCEGFHFCGSSASHCSPLLPHQSPNLRPTPTAPSRQDKCDLVRARGLRPVLVGEAVSDAHDAARRPDQHWSIGVFVEVAPADLNQLTHQLLVELRCNFGAVLKSGEQNKLYNHTMESVCFFPRTFFSSPPIFFVAPHFFFAPFFSSPHFFPPHAFPHSLFLASLHTRGVSRSFATFGRRPIAHAVVSLHLLTSHHLFHQQHGCVRIRS